MQTDTPQPHEENIMARTTFSGPVKSDNGFEGAITGNVTLATFVGLTPVATSALPAAATANQGQVRLINDNGAGNNEYCLVISTGSAWVTAVGAALS
jgi:hypothetical protein